jgi:hypothetical protein
MLSIRKLLISSVLMTGAGLLTACGGGGGAPSPTTNFTTTSINVATSKPEIGYPLDVTVNFTSNEAADNVSVSLFAVEKTDNPAATPQQYPLGSQTLAKVDVGDNVLQMHVNVPSNIDLPGQYYLTAVIDPAGIFSETNKDDNTVSTEITLDTTPGTNIKLLKLELDRSAMLVNTASYTQQVDGTAGNVYNSDAGGTITVGADGLAPNATIDIDAFAKLRITRTDTNTSYDLPLYLWNSSANRYINAYGVDPSGTTSSSNVEWLPLGTFNPLLAGTDPNDASVDDADRDSAHIEFYLPGKLGSVLENATRHYPTILSSGPTIPPPDLTANVIDQLTSFLRSLPASTDPQDPYNESAAMAVLNFSICVDIRPSDATIIDQDNSDNEVCSPIAVSLPPRATGTPTTIPPTLPPTFVPALGSGAQRVTPVPNNSGSPTAGGPTMFAFKVNFGSTTMADNHGYVEDDYGVVPINILDLDKFDFLRVDIRTQLIPDNYDGKPVGESSAMTLELRSVGQLLATKIMVPNNTEPLTIEAIAKEKEYPEPPAETTWLVGPIPISVGASVYGEFGIEYQPLVFTAEDPDYTLSVAGGPYISLGARAYAGIGSEKLGYIVGVEGLLSLLKEQIEFSNGVDIHLYRSTYPSEFVMTQGPKITNIFTGPQGYLNLYAKYKLPAIKSCKVGILKIPCPGFKNIKVTKNIMKTKALFEKSDVLYEKVTWNLDVVVPENADPLYYSTAQ